MSETHLVKSEKLRHDLSTVVGLLECTFKELQENPKSPEANTYFEMGVDRLREIIGRLDRMNEGKENADGLIELQT